MESRFTSISQNMTARLVSWPKRAVTSKYIAATVFEILSDGYQTIRQNFEYRLTQGSYFIKRVFHVQGQISKKVYTIRNHLGRTSWSGFGGTAQIPTGKDGYPTISIGPIQCRTCSERTRTTGYKSNACIACYRVCASWVRINECLCF